MGYTHYWDFYKAEKGKAKQIEAKFQKAVKACQTIIATYSKANGGLSGYSAHTNPGQYGGINVNGSRENAHETFAILEHFSENINGGFCKTARKPYDIVVVACLCTLEHFLPNNFAAFSDGDSSDWLAGLELARRVLRNKRIQMPAKIRKTLARLG